MPAEWQPHRATWMAWPADDREWRGQLEAVRQEFASLVGTLSRFEPVELLVRDEETERDARARLGSMSVRFHRFAHNDVWLRDCAPIFVTKGMGVAATDWRFNGWGGKFDFVLDDTIPQFVAGQTGVHLFKSDVVMEGGALEVNGAGVVITTGQCLLNQNRNPGRGTQEIETAVLEQLGLSRMFWLGDGLEGDHTDGHVDTITRFASEDTILTSVCDDPNDPNAEALNRNLRSIAQWRNTDGRPFRVVPLPLPRNRLEFDGERLPPTYANFYIANGVVLVPQYGDPHDGVALEVLRPLFPDRKVIGLSSRALITGGGSFHCVTQQQPQGQVWRAEWAQTN